jgi:hypothetical protein
MKKQNQSITRRDFLKETAGGAGILAVGSGSFAASIGLGRAASAGKDANPFAYDVDRLRQTDPKLIHYEQVASFRSPHEDSRRIAIGPDDQVYIAAGNYVSVLDRDGTRITDIAFPSEARCMAAAGDGTIYAAVRDHVEVFDRKGQRLATWDSPGNRTWLTGLVVPSPYLDVVLARDGLLRVNNTGRHRVEAYTLSGDLESAWGKPSNAIEGFCGCCNPIGVAMLPDGRYVTCEKGLPRVKVYSPEGVFESVVAGPESFAENAKSGINKTRADCMLGGLNAAVDSQQRIYILDLVVNDVHVMKRKA